VKTSRTSPEGEEEKKRRDREIYNTLIKTLMIDEREREKREYEIVCNGQHICNEYKIKYGLGTR